MDLGSSRRKGV
ncbi:rCG22668, partial [Rattus norvegicus]